MPRKRKPVDLSARCRFCLARESCYVELSADWVRPKVEDVAKCTGIEILDKPNYPKNICYVCLYKLETWSDLKELFLKTNKNLITHFKIIEPIVDENDKTQKKTVDELLSEDNNTKRPKIHVTESEPILPVSLPAEQETCQSVSKICVDSLPNLPTSQDTIVDAIIEDFATDSTFQAELSQTIPSDATSNSRKTGRLKKIEQREASTKRWVERKNALIAATGEMPSESDSDNGAQLSPVQKARAKANKEQEEDKKNKKLSRAMKNLETNMTEKFKVHSEDIVGEERRTRHRKNNIEVSDVKKSVQGETKANVKTKGKQQIIVKEVDTLPVNSGKEVENSAINIENSISDEPLPPQLVKSEVTVGGSTYIVTTTIDFSDSTKLNNDISLKTNGIHIDLTSQDGEKLDIMEAVKLQRVTKKQEIKSNDKSQKNSTEMEKCIKVKIEGLEVEALQRVQMELANFINKDVGKLLINDTSTKKKSTQKETKDTYEILNQKLKEIIENVIRENIEHEKTAKVANDHKLSSHYMKVDKNLRVSQPAIKISRLNLGKLCKMYRINNLHILEEVKRQRGLVGPLSRTLGKRKHVMPKKYADFSLSTKPDPSEYARLPAKPTPKSVPINNSKIDSTDEVIEIPKVTKSKTTDPQNNLSKTIVPNSDTSKTIGSKSNACNVIGPLSTVSKTVEPKNNASKINESQSNAAKTIESQRNTSMTIRPQHNITKTTEPQRNIIKITEPQRNLIKITEPQHNITKTAVPQNNVSDTTEPQNNVSNTTGPRNNVSVTTKPVISVVKPQKLVSKSSTPQTEVPQITITDDDEDDDVTHIIDIPPAEVETPNDEPIILSQSSKSAILKEPSSSPKESALIKVTPIEVLKEKNPVKLKILQKTPNSTVKNKNKPPPFINLTTTPERKLSIMSTGNTKTIPGLKKIKPSEHLTLQLPTQNSVTNVNSIPKSKTEDPKSKKPIILNSTPKTIQRQRHICGICGIELFSKAEAEAHVKNHKIDLIQTPSNEKVNNTLNKSQSFSSNISKPKPKLMRCKRCQAIVEAEYVKTHVCNSVKYNCTVCDCSFGADHLLVAHMEIHIQPKEKERKNKEVKDNILETKKTTKEDTKIIEQEEPNDSLEKILSDKPQGYSCFVCDKVFVDEEQMKDHLQMHCEEVSEEINDKGGFQCAFCGEKFQSEESLETHVGKHLMDDGDEKISMMINLETRRQKKNIFRCEQCSESFNSSLLLAMHLPIHEEEEEEAAMLAEYEKQQGGAGTEEEATEHHVCTICDEIFDTADELLEHLDVHNGNAHVCILCEKPFSSIKELQEHVSTHL